MDQPTESKERCEGVFHSAPRGFSLPADCTYSGNLPAAVSQDCRGKVAQGAYEKRISRLCCGLGPQQRGSCTILCSCSWKTGSSQGRIALCWHTLQGIGRL